MYAGLSMGPDAITNHNWGFGTYVLAWGGGLESQVTGKVCFVLCYIGGTHTQVWAIGALRQVRVAFGNLKLRPAASE